MRYINKNIASLVRIYPAQDRYGYLRMDMNENPKGLPQKFVEKVLQEITPEFLATYPEPNKVIEILANKLGLNIEKIFLANGSDACIKYIFEVFGDPCGNVVTVNPTFEMYKVYGKMFGLEHRAVDYDENLQIDLKKIIDAIDEATSIVALVNPNNPIGNVYSEQEVKIIIEKALSVGAIVIIDEAYHYFYENTLIKLVDVYDNIIILRTFSKLMSLAACRLGVAIADEKIIKYIKKAQPSFEVNAIALKFAEHILQSKTLIDDLISIEKTGHIYLTNSLLEQGYEIIDGKGNYLFIKTKKQPKEIAKLLAQSQIMVKTYAYDLLANYIRVSTGNKADMQRFLSSFLKLDGK